MGVQSPGLTHPSQRCLRPPSPPAVPVPLGQGTLNTPGCSPGVRDPAVGCQQRGQPGKDLKASHGTMDVAPSISGSSKLGCCHLSAGCGDTETSVPQAGHVVSLSPPPGGVLTRCAVPLRERAAALSPSSLTPKKHHGVPEPVAALELGAVGVLGAAR